MNTSAAPIEDSVDVRMLRGPLRTWRGAAGDAQEGIPGGIIGHGSSQWLKAGSGLSPVRENETLAPGDAAQHALGILAKLQHGDGLHASYIKLKLNFKQAPT
jgi:hypothetical protein